MADSIPPSKKSSDEMGITFNEIHSDEPHEEITPRKSELSSAHIATPKSHLSNHGDVFNVSKAFENEHIEVGTIVSDQRRKKASLGKNLQSAWGEWWGKTKQKVSGAIDAIPQITEEAPVVERAEVRKEVIEKAATNTSIAPKDDHHVVVEKFRTFRQDVAKATGTPYTIKSPTEENERSWEHVVDTTKKGELEVKQKPRRIDTPDLRSAVVAPVIETRIKKDIREFTTAPVATQRSTTPPESKREPIKTATMNIPSTVQKREIPLPKNPVHVLPSREAPKRFGYGATVTDVPPAPVVKPAPSIFKRIQTHAEEVAREPEPVKQESAPPVPTQVTPVSQAPVFKRSEAPTPQTTFVPPEIPERESVKPEPQPVKEIPSPPPVVTKRTTPPPPEQTFRDPSVQSRFEENRTPQQPAVAPAPVNSAYHTVVRWMILGMIALAGITLAVVTSIYFNVFEKNNAPVRETITIASFFATDSQAPIPLMPSDAFLGTLAKRVAESEGGLNQFYPTLSVGENARSATSEEFFTTLAVGLPEKTIRGLEDGFMIGSITTTKKEPFIIVRSYNFDSLFSGFLAWEGTLQSDLAPLFGPTEATRSSFTDAVQNNKSIRILRDSSGNEVLLYSFVNQNTVVITASTEALAKIITRF